MDDLLNPQHGATNNLTSADGENVRVTRTSSRTRGSRGVRNRGSLGSRGASCEYTRVLQSEIHEQLDHSEIQELIRDTPAIHNPSQTQDTLIHDLMQQMERSQQESLDRETRMQRELKEQSARVEQLMRVQTAAIADQFAAISRERGEERGERSRRRREETWEDEGPEPRRRRRETQDTLGTSKDEGYDGDIIQNPSQERYTRVVQETNFRKFNNRMEKFDGSGDYELWWKDTQSYLKQFQNIGEAEKVNLLTTAITGNDCNVPCANRSTWNITGYVIRCSALRAENVKWQRRTD